MHAAERHSGELAKQASSAIRAGDVRTGISLLRTAIEGDLNRERLSSLNTNLTVSPSALAHGREQFRRLSIDRPKLLEHSESAGFDALTIWVTRRFAGEGLGFIVNWDNTPPSSEDFGHVAESRSKYGTGPALLRISVTYPTGAQVGEKLSGEKQWAALVFELMNLSNSDGFERTYEQALAGNLSRTEFISEFFRLEHRAIQLTQEFYCNLYLPWARAANVSTDPMQWYISNSDWWESAEATLDRFPFASNYPWQYYGEQFNRIRKHSNARPRKSQRSPASSAARSPAQHASQATGAIRRGDYEAGLSHLLNAIELRNRHTEIVRPEKDNSSLSDEAIEHGREQFRRLSVDRPMFLRHADKQGFDRLSEWVIRRFSGEDLGTKVDWDNAIPQSVVFGHTAEHTVPGGDVRGSLRIAKVYPTGASAGEPLPFERKWSLLVYELLNLSNAREVNRMHLDVYRGKLSRVDYVTEMFRLECRAVQLTQQFYAECYLPWALKAQLPSNPDFWFVSEAGWWEDAEVFLDQYPFSRDYPWGYYEREFQSIRRTLGAQRGEEKHCHGEICELR